MTASTLKDTPKRKPTRAERKAARRAAANQVLPPEGVPLTLEVAGVSVRLGAQIADIVITLVGALAVVFLLASINLTRPDTFESIIVLMFFMIRVPYYIMTELIWNGQTLGKKLLKIKVVSHDGSALSTHAIVTRNMMKEAEVFLPATLLLGLSISTPFSTLASLAWITLALAIPLMNPFKQRLGDMIAGTHVIHLPEPILLKDLASEAPPEVQKGDKKIVFLPHQLDHYGAYELQTLEAVLRAQDKPMGPDAHGRNRKTLISIVEKIRKKIGYADAIAPEEAKDFLRVFYNAQREHLEQRQLFGDRRANKYHKDETNQS